EVWTWWALFAGSLTVLAITLLRLPFLDTTLGVSGAASQFGLTMAGLCLGGPRLKGAEASTPADCRISGPICALTHRRRGFPRGSSARREAQRGLACRVPCSQRKERRRRRACWPAGPCSRSVGEATSAAT